jgi:hypothetical protein
MGSAIKFILANALSVSLVQQTVAQQSKQKKQLS